MPRNICEPPSFFCSTHSLKSRPLQKSFHYQFHDSKEPNETSPRTVLHSLHIIIYIRTYILLRSSKSVCRLQIWGRSYFYKPKKILNISLCAYYLLLLPNEVCSAPSSPLLRRALLRNKLNNNSLINSDKNEKKPFP